MPVSATRFKMLSDDVNVPVVSTFTGAGTSVFNSIENDNKANIESVQSIIDGAVSGIQIPVVDTGIASAVSTATRSAKGLFGNITDIRSMATDQIKDFMKDIIPGAETNDINNLTKLASGCSSSGMGMGLPGRPYDASVGCNNGQITGGVGYGYGGSRSYGCNAANYGNILNALTGNQYGGTFSDLSKLLMGILALSGFGYNMGMCGVFGAVAGKYGNGNNSLLGRASGALLGKLGIGGNTLGAIDVMKSSAGLTTLLENPSSIKGFFSNFKIPSVVGQRGYTDLAEKSFLAPDMLDSAWTSSKYDNMLSISQTGGGTSELSTVMGSYLKKNSFSDVTQMTANDDDFIKAAMCFG